MQRTFGLYAIEPDGVGIVARSPRKSAARGGATVCQSLLRDPLASTILCQNPGAEETTMTNEIKHRPRGASPRGVFEQSKSIAQAIIDDRRDAERLKTERLKAARLENVQLDGSRKMSSKP
jgi:hypothetical protein